jgi:hypothetical protein
MMSERNKQADQQRDATHDGALALAAEAHGLRVLGT